MSKGKCFCGKKWSMQGLAAVVDAALSEGRQHVRDEVAVGSIVAQVQIKALVEHMERGACLSCAVAGLFEATLCPEVRTAMQRALPAVEAAPMQVVQS